MLNQIPSQMIQAILITVGLICLDTLLGWIKALANHEWDWRKVCQFLQTSVLPYIGGLLALAVLALLQPDSMTAVFYASTAAADVKLVADIVSKISGFGVPVQKPEGTNGKE
jgi:heme A synthase